MFGKMSAGANAYSRVGVETGVAAANPHALIVLLFDGALVAVNAAIHCMQAGDIPNKGAAVSKAISIIDNGLRASLDKAVGGEVALNLDALYEYMSNRLVIANLKNQTAILDEVYKLLKGLKDSWEAIAPAPIAPATSTQPPVHDTLAPRSANFIKA